MSDLVFATRGQAEMLAAQEEVRKKALETKQEFEEGAKATGSWDAAMMKLKGQAESALRSVNSEQEKILDKIAKIQQAQEKGIIPPEAAKEAETALQRLRQEWIDVDEATLKAAESTEKAREATERQEQANARLKSTAESALRSIQTEEEQIEEKISDIEVAMQGGLVPPKEAEEGIQRLRDRLEEVRSQANDTRDAGGRLGDVIAKAFDPMQIAKWAFGLVSVKAGIGQLRAEFEDLQDAIDKRIASNAEPKEKGDKLTSAAAAAEEEAAAAAVRTRDAELQLSKARNLAQQQDAAEEAARANQLRELDRKLARAKEDLQKGEADRQAGIGKVNQEIAQSWQGKGRGPSQSMLERLAELESQGTTAELKRRIEDIQRQQADAVFGQSSRDPASLNAAAQAVDDARRNEAAKRQAAAAAAQDRDAFAASPEGQRAAAIAARKQGLRDIKSEVAGRKSIDAFDAEEQQLVDDILQQVGTGPTKRLLLKLLDQLDDGIIDTDEFAGRVRGEAQGLRQPKAIQQQGSIGTNVPLTIAPTAEAIRDSESLEKVARLLEDIKMQSGRPYVNGE